MILLQEGSTTYEVRNVQDLGDGSFEAQVNLDGYWNTCYGLTSNLIVLPEALPLRAYADDYGTEYVEAINQYHQDVLAPVDYAYDWQQEVTEELSQLWLEAA